MCIKEVTENVIKLPEMKYLFQGSAYFSARENKHSPHFEMIKGRKNVKNK
jgi:hypothetical protein